MVMIELYFTSEGDRGPEVGGGVGELFIDLVLKGMYPI